MENIFAMMLEAVKVKWTGEVRIRFYFGQLKGAKLVTAIDPEKKIDIKNFKQPL